jgi:hypothetical protein
MVGGVLRLVLTLAFLFGDVVTFIYLIVQDAPDIDRWWKWPIIIAIELFLSSIWPIYWGVLHWAG